MSQLNILFGKTRRAVLGLLYLHDSNRYYLRQIASMTGQSVGSLQRELGLLVDAGIVLRKRDGNQVYYSVNHSCPIFYELKSIFTKTIGLGDLIRERLLPLADRCQVVFIYGSIASGIETELSDVDIMVIGHVSFADVSDCLTDIQMTLQREVNPNIYPPDEFASKAQTPYLQSVVSSPKIFLIGTEDDLTAVVAQ